MAKKNDVKRTAEYDEQHRPLLEVIESSDFRNVIRYTYEHDWICRDIEFQSSDDSVHYHCFERERPDGSEWSQEMFDDTTGSLSYMRMFLLENGDVVWHNTDLNSKGRVRREFFLNRNTAEGVTELEIRDGKFVGNTLHPTTIMNA